MAQEILPMYVFYDVLSQQLPQNTGKGAVERWGPFESSGARMMGKKITQNPCTLELAEEP